MAAETENTEGRGSHRRTLVGTVTSDKMQKTVVVMVTHRVKSVAYKKYMTKRVKYKAHNEQNDVHVGDKDAIVSDGSFFDLNMLGQVGVIPGWPGAEVAPPQPMKVQTRAVLDRYRANGGSYTEVALPDAGHAPHLDEADAFVAALVRHIAGR